MSEGKITANMTVREVMVRYPKSEHIFNKYGLTGCGGPKGPVEPIGFFATVHQVDPDQLLKELNELAANSPEEDGGPGMVATEPLIPELYKPFLKAAVVVALTVGCTLGAINLLAMALGGSVGTTWLAITQAHGHAQIFGWVGLFIMGVAYHTLPRLKATELQGYPLAVTSFWLVLGGIVLRVIGQPLATTTPIFGWLVVVSAFSELIGVSFFAYVIQRTLASNPQSGDFYDSYILASVGWFWILAASNVVFGIYTARSELDALPTALDMPYLHVGLMGFVAMMIFGYTLRTVPVFMGLRPPNKRAFGAIFWVLNGAIAARALTLLVQGVWAEAIKLEAIAGLAEWIAVIAFVYFLNIFRRPEVNISELGASRGYEKFIRVAYLWLPVAVTLSAAYSIYHAVIGQEVPHSLVGAYRHALTVGFISMMIMGMASRIVPVFAGVRLHSRVLLLASFVLLNVGNLLRVVSQPLADFIGDPFFATMGISGFIEVAALTLFAYNLWRTMEGSPREEMVPIHNGPITKDMVVADVLARYPHTLEIFVQYGFTPLKNPLARRTLARAVTIEEAVRIHTADLDHLLADLNRVAGLAHQKVQEYSVSSK